MRKPSPNDLLIYAEIEGIGGALPAAVRAVATKHGYKASAVYGIRRRVEIWNKAQSAPKPVIAEGQQLKGVSSYVDASGTILRQWIKTDQRKEDWARLIEVALERASHLNPLPANHQPPRKYSPTTTVYPISDWHVGLDAATRNGWTLDKAAAVYRAAFAELVAGSSSSTALLVFLGDFTHIDNQSNTTQRSGKKLDVTGQYAEVVEVAMQLIVDAITLAQAQHERVEIAYLAGNHDSGTAVVMQAALKHLYSRDPRVTVHPSGLFFYRQIEDVLLGFTHSHTVKSERLPLLMATDEPKLWGATRYRVFHCGHLHHRIVTEYAGCLVETHSAPTPRDAWHDESGYRANRAMTSITYDTTGERTRITVNL